MTDNVIRIPRTGPIRVTATGDEPVSVRVMTQPVTVRVAGQPGPQGAPGNDGASWTFYATRWSSPPSQVGTATVSGAAGAVFSYTVNGVTRFRFVPDSYSPALDTFWSAFSAGSLSDQLAARG